MGYECRVGRFDGKGLSCFCTYEIEGKFWDVVVCGERAASDEPLGLKAVKAISDVARGTLGEKGLYLSSGEQHKV